MGPSTNTLASRLCAEMLGGQIFGPASSGNVPTEIWATSSMFLNDTKEFVRGREVIQLELARLPNDEIRNSMRRALKSADALEVYCACFSAIDDDLSQWRGYGDHGAGVCIEYDLAKLIAGSVGRGYWVIYGKPGKDAVQTETARSLLTYIYSTIRYALPSPPVPNSVYTEIREQLTETWPALFLAFKHLDFSAEREFRLVHSEAVGGPRDVFFRPAPLVPFVKLGMYGGGRLPITAIRLGPAASSDANARSLKFALGKLALTEIAVRKSDIPYVPQ